MKLGFQRMTEFIGFFDNQVIRTGDGLIRLKKDFAYATQISVGPFIFAIFLAILLAILTVSYQSIKISSANPAKALKTE